MLVCPKCGKTTRISHVLGEHNKFLRCCKKCGAVIDQHKCDGCGMCMEVCPANAVSMTSPQKRAN